MFILVDNPSLLRPQSSLIIIKIFLFICLIVSSGFCSYLIIELIMGYYSYGVLTAMRTLYETPVTFPKVTICNANPFTTQYAVEFLKKINRKNSQKKKIFEAFFSFFCLKCSAVVVAAAVVVIDVVVAVAAVTAA